MSGGHFQYNQYKLQMIAEKIEELIEKNNCNDKNQWGDVIGNHYSRETMREFDKAVSLLKQAYVYTQRIDWLVSGDDGEDSFHRRLADELAKVKD
jgi:repressor of nif and glnA expression